MVSARLNSFFHLLAFFSQVFELRADLKGGLKRGKVVLFLMHCGGRLCAINAEGLVSPDHGKQSLG